MKGLWKYINPFAPDQSGAASVLYSLDGIIVICDAGGCAGNICGFDEPRWFSEKSAVFSAGLRDMDAVLGRDEKLVEKLADTARKIDARFAAIIGTPVPSVIGTDYSALCKMAEQRINIPVFSVDTTGMELYDVGASKAYVELFKKFALEQMPVVEGRVGVLGFTPLDFGEACDAGKMTIERIIAASSVEKNIVVAPSGLAAARWLKKKFGTPYEVYDPLAAGVARNFDDDELRSAPKILIVDQQVRANTMREALEAYGCEVVAATWFMQDSDLAREGDVRLREEDELAELLRDGNFDILIGDKTMFEVAPEFAGRIVDVPHFAVSGRIAEPAKD